MAQYVLSLDFFLRWRLYLRRFCCVCSAHFALFDRRNIDKTISQVETRSIFGPVVSDHHGDKHLAGNCSDFPFSDILKAMTTEEQIALLTGKLNQVVAELSQTQEELCATKEELLATQEKLHVAQARIEELEKQKTPPPAFVKAKVKKPEAGEKKARKKRDAQFNRGRARMQATQHVEHRLINCPDCHLRLGGISLARLREVMDLPPPAAVEVREHQIYKGWCANCQRWHEAPVDLHDQVLGQGRIGHRLASLIATLRTVMRLPFRQIQTYLATLHGVHLSVGELVELLHRISKHVEPMVADLKEQVQTSPAIQADETGWREDGKNGYIWSVSTPEIRYYEYHHSRGSDVVKTLIGETYEGVLGSDFYAAYNIHQGLHQRCWVHFLRDVHDLKEKYPQDEALFAWAASVKALYERAVAWAESGPDPGLSPRQEQQERQAHQHVFEQQLWQVCQPYLRTAAPQRTLCERVERFLPELFVFVRVPGVPAHNNLAERSVRPLVIARKVSGGTRSPQGSQTRMSLASLFGTWSAQHLNPFYQCLAALSTKSSLGQV
jgi:transposase